MLSRSRTHSDARSGFTLLELAAVLAVGSVVMTQLMPMAKRTRNTTRGMGSAANLMTIGQGAGMYGLDNEDRIFNFSWPGPEPSSNVRVEYFLPNGDSELIFSDFAAASVQETEILQRRTGRIDGDFEIEFYDERVPFRRRISLVLLDYLGAAPGSQLFIDPADANQLVWSDQPLSYDVGSSVPYANGYPADVDSDVQWDDLEVRQRWAFSSSYQPTSSAWQPDGLDAPVSHPVADSPHLFRQNSPGDRNLVETSDGRRFSEVAFPTAKVYFFEEHDREQAGDPYFGYDQARPEKLMFDGSVNNWASGDASPSWNVEEGKTPWTQAYVPLDQFPIPLGGLGDDTPISQRYRWTLGGLQGVDYATPIRTGRR